jgi:hypothetical protein
MSNCQPTCNVHPFFLIGETAGANTKFYTKILYKIKQEKKLYKEHSTVQTKREETASLRKPEELNNGYSIFM